MQPCLDTERLTLRPLARADRDALLAVNRASLDHHAPGLTPMTENDAFEARFDRTILGPNVTFVARERETDRIAAVVSLTDIVLGLLRSAYLGYYGTADTAGRGLVAEAVHASIHYGFERIGLHRIEANIQPGNRRSIRMIRRLGFRLEGLSPGYLRINGIWSDCERWALLDREFDRSPGDGSWSRSEAAEAFWQRFHQATGLGTGQYAVTDFGNAQAMKNELAVLVLRRRKRATASLLVDTRAGGQVPAPGDLSIVVDGQGTPVCVIRTSEVRLGPLASVDDAFAWDEGEGDRTRAGWLREHRDYFGRDGITVEDQTDVLFERFGVIWPDLA